MKTKEVLPPPDVVATVKDDSPVENSRRRPTRGLRYRWRVVFSTPTTLIGVLALALFLYLIVVPIIVMLSDAMLLDPHDVAVTGQTPGSLTTYYLWRVFVSPAAINLFWTPLLNTVVVAVCSVTLSLIFGGTLAWLLAKTDIWGQRWFSNALIVPYMLPTWAFALAWTTIFKNRTLGGETGWLEAVGITPPDWLAYGGLPMIVIFTLYFSPYVILLFGNALKRFDSQLEDSARMLGARPRVVFTTVVLPLMRPSLIAAMTLILAKVLGEFGVAYILGLPTNFTVLSTSLYRSISSRSPGVGAVIAGAIILIGVLSLWIDVHFLKEAKRFVTVGGKGAMDRTRKLGRWRLPATLMCSLVFAVSVAIPIGVLFLSTVMRIPGNFSLSNFTGDFWFGRNLPTPGFPDGIFLSSPMWAAAINSFWIVGLSSLLAGVLGMLVGYVVVRSPSKLLSNGLRQVTFLPYLVPGIAFAVAYLALFSVQRGPIPALYGTAAILVLIYMAEQMPFASRAGITSMMQLGTDPEDAAQVAGAGWWRRLFTIVLPIQKGALATAILMPFIAGIRSLSLVIILAVPGMDVLTTLAIRLVDYGYSQAANGIVLIVSAIAFFGTYTIQKLMKTDLGQGLGG